MILFEQYKKHQNTGATLNLITGKMSDDELFELYEELNKASTKDLEEIVWVGFSGALVQGVVDFGQEAVADILDVSQPQISQRYRTAKAIQSIFAGLNLIRESQRCLPLS